MHTALRSIPKTSLVELATAHSVGDSNYVVKSTILCLNGVGLGTNEA